MYIVTYIMYVVDQEAYSCCWRSSLLVLDTDKVASAEAKRTVSRYRAEWLRNVIVISHPVNLNFRNTIESGHS